MFTGEPIPRLDAPWLALVPLFAVLGALVLAVRPKLRVAAALPALPALAALVLAPANGVLHAHLANVLRLGFVELRLDLAADRGASLVAIAMTVTALVVGPSPRRLVLLALGLSLVLLDDRLLAALVWSALVIALAPGRVARLASALAAVASVILFWGLGGAFTGEGYAPEMGPRVVAIVSGEAAPVAASAFDDDDDDEVALPQYAAGDHGSLAVRAFPGAALHVDGAHAPSPRVPPFEGQSIPAGYHTFRLHPGQAYDDYVVPQMRIDPGQRVTLVAVGSTTSALDARDATQARSGASAPFAEALAQRRLLGLSLVAFVGILLALAVAGAARSPLLALAAIALIEPFVAVTGPIPEAALVALTAACLLGSVSSRADVFLAVAAVFAGAPLPAALALALAGWLPERRATAIATIVPRAVIFGSLLAGPIPHATWLAAGFLLASILVLVAPRTKGPVVPKWYGATFAVALVGAVALAVGVARPSLAAWIPAVATATAGFVPAATWERRRRYRIDLLRRVRNAGGALGRMIGDGLAAVEARAGGER